MLVARQLSEGQAMRLTLSIYEFYIQQRRYLEKRTVSKLNMFILGIHKWSKIKPSIFNLHFIGIISSLDMV